MKGYVVDNKSDKIKEILPKDFTAACEGLITLFESKVIDFLRSGHYNFLDRYEKNLIPEDTKRIYRKAFNVDGYFKSTNEARVY